MAQRRDKCIYAPVKICLRRTNVLAWMFDRDLITVPSESPGIFSSSIGFRDLSVKFAQIPTEYGGTSPGPNAILSTGETRHPKHSETF
jgi:hypothetical protein